MEFYLYINCEYIFDENRYNILFVNFKGLKVKKNKIYRVDIVFVFILKGRNS